MAGSSLAVTPVTAHSRTKAAIPATPSTTAAVDTRHGGALFGPAPTQPASHGSAGWILSLWAGSMSGSRSW